MPELAEIEALYEGYIAQVGELERNRKPGEGLFGMKGGPADDPCHDRFAEELRALLAAFAARDPASSAVREVLTYMYAAPLEHREPNTAYWMLAAVHGLALDLIDRLDRADAAALWTRYAKDYPRWERLPVQKQTLDKLKKQRA